VQAVPRLSQHYFPTFFRCRDAGPDNNPVSPTGDFYAESEIGPLSHEIVGAVNDPFGNGWYASPLNDGEIADRCDQQLGGIQLHGRGYVVARIWNNVKRRCVTRS